MWIQGLPVSLVTSVQLAFKVIFAIKLFCMFIFWICFLLSQILLFQVEFADDLYFTGIEIYETLNAGAVIRISAWDPSNNKWITIWETNAPQLIQHSRCFSPPITVGCKRKWLKGIKNFACIRCCYFSWYAGVVDIYDYY